MLAPGPPPQLTIFDNSQQNLASRQRSWRYKVPTRFVRVVGHVADTDCLQSPSGLPGGGTLPAAECDTSSYPNMTCPALDSSQHMIFLAQMAIQ